MVLYFVSNMHKVKDVQVVLAISGLTWPEIGYTTCLVMFVSAFTWVQLTINQFHVNPSPVNFLLEETLFRQLQASLACHHI